MATCGHGLHRSSNLVMVLTSKHLVQKAADDLEIDFSDVVFGDAVEEIVGCARRTHTCIYTHTHTRTPTSVYITVPPSSVPYPWRRRK